MLGLTAGVKLSVARRPHCSTPSSPTLTLILLATMTSDSVVSAGGHNTTLSNINSDNVIS